jgi:hypothetical protein
LYFQADQICYAVLCVFSYVAAGMEKGEQQEKRLQEKQILEKQQLAQQQRKQT